MASPAEALSQLKEGNRRFAEGQAMAPRQDRSRREEVAGGQAPFAAVLGCADSRVPPEVIFDQGLGDLFVVRVAGNVAGAMERGSLELAATELGVKLILVLGHASCGAVSAAAQAVDSAELAPSEALQGVVDAVRPALDAGPGPSDGGAGRLALAEDENVRRSVRELRASPVLGGLEQEGAVRLIGAKYDPAGGQVTFFGTAHG